MTYHLIVEPAALAKLTQPPAKRFMVGQRQPARFGQGRPVGAFTVVGVPDHRVDDAGGHPFPSQFQSREPLAAGAE